MSEKSEKKVKDLKCKSTWGKKMEAMGFEVVEFWDDDGNPLPFEVVKP